LNNGLHQERETGLEPATSSLGSYNAPAASGSSKELTATPSDACTTACTSEAENANAGTLDADQGDEGEGIDQGGTAGGSSTADQGDPLAVLAAAVANLSPADRERLAAMLTGHQGKGEGGTA
jgi:hypothetical protein